MQIFPALAQQPPEFATVTLEPESTAKPPQLLAAATSLPRHAHFASPDKIRTMFKRNAKSKLLEDEQALEHGIEIGRGGFWLELNEEQYPALRRP